MKEVMASESSGEEQGVPTFEYNPAFRDQGLLFELSRPLDDLGDMLLQEFAGETRTMNSIYEPHNYDTPFIEKNYKSILNQLESNGKIKCEPPAAKRPKRKGKRTFGPKTKVTFLRRQ